MSLSLLYKPGSVQLGLILGGVMNQFGAAGSVLLRPDTGQYWLPVLVRVSSKNGTPCRVDLCSGSVAALQAGNKNFATNGALSDPTTVKDFTAYGQNDTSSILSGTIIAPGEGIQVNFYNAVGGFNDTGYVEVWGYSSDVPPFTPGAEVEPLVPGVKFSGADLAGNLPTAAAATTLVTWNAEVVAPGNFSVVGQPFAADLRGYSSYELQLSATKTLGSTVNIDSVTASLVWSDNTGSNLYTETYQWFVGDNGGVTPLQIAPNLEIQDSVHGEFLGFTIKSNTANIDNITLNGELRGNIRPLSRPYLRNLLNGVGAAANTVPLGDTTIILANNQVVGAGQTFSVLTPLRPGQAHLWFNATAVGMVINIDDPTNTILLYQTGSAAAGNFDYRFIMPCSAVRINFNNTSGGAISIFSTLTIEEPSKGT